MEYYSYKGYSLPYFGYGTWTIGDHKENEEKEIHAILYSVNQLGMTLIDTAEMYGNGKAELVIGKALKQLDRSKLFIVDKILPENAKAGKYEECCRASLKRMGIDYFDLYLLHWRNNVDLKDMIDNMERLKKLGLIKHWGVSNFDTRDMDALFYIHNGKNCFCNQILYNVTARGIEYDLIPWCHAHHVLLMAYSPLCNETVNRTKVTSNPKIIALADKENKTPESLMLSFTIRNHDFVTLMKSSNIEHLNSNLKNVFNPVDMDELDKIYPPVDHKVELEKI